MRACLRFVMIACVVLAACARAEPPSPVAATQFAADDMTWYRLEARSPAVVLDVRTGRVTLSTHDTAAAPLWHIHRLDDGRYVLSNARTGPCLRLAVGRTARPVPVVLERAAPNVPDQHWTIAPAGDGVRWRLGSEAFGTRARLDATAASPAGTPLLAKARATEGQAWTIVPAGRAGEDGDCFNH